MATTGIGQLDHRIHIDLSGSIFLASHECYFQFFSFINAIITCHCEQCGALFPLSTCV